MASSSVNKAQISEIRLTAVPVWQAAVDCGLARRLCIGIEWKYITCHIEQNLPEHYSTQLRTEAATKAGGHI